ncbi:MAG: efflux RND transporter permease subunit [Planctomycetota bacterium]
MSAEPREPAGAAGPGQQGRGSLTGRIVELFLTGNLTPLLVLMSLVAGAFALTATPREEEPQIVVPLADVHIEVPGATALEVEKLVSTRLEKLLYQIDGVEYVYSQSRPDRSIVTVRFFVGEDREDSLVKVHSKLQQNLDLRPGRGLGRQGRSRSTTSVFLATLWSDQLDDFALRRVAEECESRLQAVPDTGRTEVVGGRPRRMQVLLDPDRLESHECRSTRSAARSGRRRWSAVAPSSGGGRRSSSTPAPEPLDHHEVGALIVAVHDGRPSTCATSPRSATGRTRSPATSATGSASAPARPPAPTTPPSRSRWPRSAGPTPCSWPRPSAAASEARARGRARRRARSHHPRPASRPTTRSTSSSRASASPSSS